MAKEEEKRLLLQDLCARLPYGVICECLHSSTIKATAIDTEDLSVYYFDCDEWESIEHCKPYLRPMSSMTEYEQEEFFDLIICADNGNAVVEEDKIYAYNNFIYSHHLDNKNFIEKGLAIEAPSDMYNNNTRTR